MTDPLDQVVARDEIRQLAYRYADAVDRRDLDLLVDLYVPDARFGPYGEGPEACRRFWADSLSTIGMAVLFVGNHLIDLDDADHARGTVWCRGYVDDPSHGFIEQMIKYVDRYRRVDGRWRFVARKHLLWYGVRTAESPLAQPPADWPERQVGAGSIPWDDPTWEGFWAEHGPPAPPTPVYRHHVVERLLAAERIEVFAAIVERMGLPAAVEVGAQRRVAVRGFELTETVISVEPPWRLAYEITEGAPIRRFQGVIHLVPESEGCRVVRSYLADPRPDGSSEPFLALARATFGHWADRLADRFGEPPVVAGP